MESELSKLLPLHCIGRIHPAPGVYCVRDGQVEDQQGGGYDHFA